MTFLAWLSVAGLCFLGAASPGPSLALVLHHGLAGSRLNGMVCALAHALGVTLYALATTVGLAAFLAGNSDLYRLIASMGALYLLVFGARLACRRQSRAGEQTRRTGRDSWFSAARDGLAMALTNPKIALFFLALFSQFVGPDPGLRVILLLTLTAGLVDAGWYLAVAVAASASRESRFGSLHGASLDRVLGLALLAIGLWTLVVQWPG